MTRFFLDRAYTGGVVMLSGEILSHLRVLRMQPGEQLILCDGRGTDWLCRLVSVGAGGAEAEVLSETPSAGEPDVEARVFAAFSKGERMDYAVQKCVELGASEIVLFPSARCVVKYDGAALEKKLARWRRIAAEAAQQSGRGIIPRLEASPSCREAFLSAAKSEPGVFLYEEERAITFRETLSGRELRSVALVTGPEGGFEPSEAELAAECGLVSATLGPRILRCETAPAAALAALMYHTGNL